MRKITLKWLKRALVAAGLILATVLAVRAFDAWRAPPLALWHSHVPNELHAAAIDDTDWAGWLAAEAAVFDEVRTMVTDQLPASDHIPTNRYFAGSPMHASHFATDRKSSCARSRGNPWAAIFLMWSRPYKQ